MPPAPTPLGAALRDHLSREVRFLFEGESWRDRSEIARLLLYLHLRAGRLGGLTRRLPRRPVREFDVQLRNGPYLRLRSSDVVAVLIYGIGEYDVDLSPLGQVSSLLDLGGNVGLASIAFAARLSGLRRIASVEPEPENYRLLKTNFERNLPAATPLNVAVVGEPGRYRLATNPLPGMTRVVSDERVGEQAVPALTLPEVLNRVGMASVDLMKIDIEGEEARIFRHAREWAPRVRAILGEVHSPLTVDVAQEWLAPFGFQPLPVPSRPGFDDILFLHKSHTAPAG